MDKKNDQHPDDVGLVDPAEPASGTQPVRIEPPGKGVRVIKNGEPEVKRPAEVEQVTLIP
ncbi:MAG: hypothetical protein ACO1OB_16950 [Archangium sp.]